MSREPSKMRKLLTILSAAGILLSATACKTRTVVIDSRADVVRLGRNVRGEVYIWDKDKKAWVLSSKVTLPEGWYAGPPPP